MIEKPTIFYNNNKKDIYSTRINNMNDTMIYSNYNLGAVRKNRKSKEKNNCPAKTNDSYDDYFLQENEMTNTNTQSNNESRLNDTNIYFYSYHEDDNYQKNVSKLRSQNENSLEDIKEYFLNL